MSAAQQPSIPPGSVPSFRLDVNLHDLLTTPAASKPHLVPSRETKVLPEPVLLQRVLLIECAPTERARVLLQLVEGEFEFYGTYLALKRLPRVSCYFAKFLPDFPAFRKVPSSTRRTCWPGEVTAIRLMSSSIVVRARILAPSVYSTPPDSPQ